MPTIAYPNPIPARSAQANPFTPMDHDDIHGWLMPFARAVADWINSFGIPGNSQPTGTYLPYIGTTAPSGYLMANGQVVSQATYPALYTLCGTTYNTGGEGAGNFRVPDLRGRVPIGCNPMGGSTTGSYSTRTLGTVYGAETYTNAAVAVSGDVPSRSVSFSNMGSVTFPTFSAGAFPTLNAGAFPTFNAGAFQTLTAGTLPSVSGGTLPSLTINGAGAISSESKTNVAVTAAACLKVTVVPEALDEAARCSGMTVDAFTVDITKANILGALTFEPGAFQTISPGAFPALTGGTLPSSMGGTLPSLISGTLPSSMGGNSTVTGAAATTPITALSGVTASIAVPLIQPSLTTSYILKY